MNYIKENSVYIPEFQYKLGEIVKFYNFIPFTDREFMSATPNSTVNHTSLGKIVARRLLKPCGFTKVEYDIKLDNNVVRQISQSQIYKY